MNSLKVNDRSLLKIISPKVHYITTKCEYGNCFSDVTRKTTNLKLCGSQLTPHPPQDFPSQGASQYSPQPLEFP